jgi:hypothetical protein
MRRRAEGTAVTEFDLSDDQRRRLVVQERNKHQGSLRLAKSDIVRL